MSRFLETNFFSSLSLADSNSLKRFIAVKLASEMFTPILALSIRSLSDKADKELE
jgi:hypothetical protein